MSFVVKVSERLAATEPQLTHEFLNEFFVGWDKTLPQQRPLNVLYMVPWIVNLRTHVLSLDGDGDRGKEKLTAIARKLVELALQEPRFSTIFQHNIWPAIAKDEVVVEVVLEELIKSAVGDGLGGDEAEAVCSIIAALDTVVVRGKVIARLRKALNRSSLRPTRQLTDNVVWAEICILLRICLAMSFGSRVQVQMFLPELFHIITMTANVGVLMIRTSVHSLLVNIVHSMCISFPLDETNLGKLKALLASLSDPKVGLLFKLHRAAAHDTVTGTESWGSEGTSSSSVETIATLLLEIITVAAPSVNMANTWRARWMSLRF